jgi:hypothetical protein
LKLPNWFKVIWWFLLLGAFTYLVFQRHGAIITGQTSSSDLLIISVWVVLFLAPVFQEVSVFGLSLKQNINELKREVSELRNYIRIGVQAQINPTINFPAYNLESQKDEINQIIHEELKKHNIQPAKDIGSEVPEDAIFMFKVRYQLEREIERLWNSRMSDPTFTRPKSTLQMAFDLSNEGLIPSNLIQVINSVYRAASAGIHGLTLRPRIDFVKEIAPDLIAVLKKKE